MANSKNRCWLRIVLEEMDKESKRMMEYAERLAELSNQFLRYQKEERELFWIEWKRQEDGVMIKAPEWRTGDVLYNFDRRTGDVLYDQYVGDRSYVRRRLKILRYYIRKLVNSGRLENRDYRYLQENGLIA